MRRLVVELYARHGISDFEGTLEKSVLLKEARDKYLDVGAIEGIVKRVEKLCALIVDRGSLMMNLFKGLTPIAEVDEAF